MRVLFDPQGFTLYELSRQLRIKYHKAIRMVNFLIEHGKVERVDHGGDKRKRRYKLL